MANEMLTDTFTRLRRSLHRVATRLLQDETEAEDAVQDAFCNLLGSRMPGNYDEARYRLFAILRNVCLNKIRKKKTDPLPENTEIPVQPDDYDDSERVREMLMTSLSPMQRRIFELVVVGSLDYSEIAEVTELSVEAVRMHMSRARKILREKYQQL